MSDDAVKEAQARAFVVAWVMDALGEEFEQCGEELARRVMEHARAFHASLRWDGTGSPEEHLRRVNSAGNQAICASVTDALGLVKAALRQRDAD